MNRSLTGSATGVHGFTTVQWWIFIAVFCVLTALTASSASPEFRAVSIPGGALVSSSDLTAQGWQVRGNADRVIFSDSGITLSQDGHPSIRVKHVQAFNVQTDALRKFDYARVSGTIKRLSAARAIEDPKKQPLLITKFFKGSRISFYGPVIRQTGLIDQDQFSRLITPPHDSERIEIEWLLRSPGSWQLSDLNIELSSTSVAYTYARYALLLSALMMSLIFLFAIRACLSWWQLLVLGASLAAAVGLIGMRKSAVRHVVLSVHELILEWMPGDWVPSMVEVQKAAHVALFVCLTGLLIHLRHRLNMSVFHIVALLLTLASFTEAIQLHQLGRSGSVSDIAIDLGGILAMVVLWRVFVFLFPDKNSTR